MTRTHERSASPDSITKRLKTSHTLATNSELPSTNTNYLNPSDNTPNTTVFADSLFDHNTISKLHASYITNQPFKFAVVETLFQDDLLRNVKDECLSELNFTEKQTDIYKVNQTGDLASLNYLSKAQMALLPNLLALRDALYSQKFRSFLQTVTGCGPLSGKKQDMSVNSYKKGCHLLNHDDVIGTRRVSYILYMPLPHYQVWQKDWGGALELYPVKKSEDGQMEPENFPSKSIPPSWNQFIFFEVQPGRSFHSVEEVVIGGGEDGRERLSISGWFHAAQQGEEGYTPETSTPYVKSSREQLTSTSTVFTPFPETSPTPHPDSPLTEEDIGFLSEFLNPVYLQPRTMVALSERFAEESSLELHAFLHRSLSESLQVRLREADAKDGLGENRAGRIPPHTAGTQGGWSVMGPPHKWRYCVLNPPAPGGPVEQVTPRAAHASSDEILRSLQNELFPSPAFRAWLAVVSRLLPLSYAAQARRFRPGLDYTLAISDETDVKLDVVLGLTPGVRDHGKGEGSSNSKSVLASALDDTLQWNAADWGGWECYMAPHNEEEDPAVYRSSSHGKMRRDGGNDHSTNEVSKPTDSEQSMSDEEDDDSTLLTVQPSFNRLLLVLRDERVMHFLKYVSAAAEGSRWDVCGEYEVGMLADMLADEDLESS